MSFLIAFEYCQQSTLHDFKWLAGSGKELVWCFFQEAELWTYTTSGDSVQSEATRCTGRSPLSVQWRPKTSSLYVVCWNAKCFPSSCASSTPRCPTPARAAFGVSPSSTGTTWANDKRRRYIHEVPFFFLKLHMRTTLQKKNIYIY